MASGVAVGGAWGPRAWYGRNRVLAWMCVLIAVNQLGFGAIVPVVPLYARSFGVPQAAIGLTIAIYGLARVLVAMPAGQVADRLGRRGALAAGGLVTSAGNLLCAHAAAYLPFLAARFVAGAGAGVIMTAAQVVLADISTPARRGRIMATYSGVFAFAVGAGPYPGGLLAERFGLAAPFDVFAGLALLAAAVAWFQVPETRGLGRQGGGGQAGEAPLPYVRQVRLLTRRAGFALVSLVSFSAAFARTGALFNVIPVLARERLALAPDRIGLGLSLISVAGFLLAYPSGVLVDTFGRKAVIVPAVTVTGLSLVVFALAPSYAWFLAACAVWSVALGIGSDAPGAYAADMAPPGMNAAAMSSYRMLSDGGYVLGPLLLGLIADRWGAGAALAVTALLLVAVGGLFARFAPETYRARRPVLQVPAVEDGDGGGEAGAGVAGGVGDHPEAGRGDHAERADGADGAEALRLHAGGGQLPEGVAGQHEAGPDAVAGEGGAAQERAQLGEHAADHGQGVEDHQHDAGRHRR